jgi:hypothetical protein
LASAGFGVAGFEVVGVAAHAACGVVPIDTTRAAIQLSFNDGLLPLKYGRTTEAGPACSSSSRNY